jgi:hypothetical protein
MKSPKQIVKFTESSKGKIDLVSIDYCPEEIGSKFVCTKCEFEGNNVKIKTLKSRVETKPTNDLKYTVVEIEREEYYKKGKMYKIHEVQIVSHECDESMYVESITHYEYDIDTMLKRTIRFEHYEYDNSLNLIEMTTDKFNLHSPHELIKIEKTHFEKNGAVTTAFVQVLNLKTNNEKNYKNIDIYDSISHALLRHYVEDENGNTLLNCVYSDYTDEKQNDVHLTKIYSKGDFTKGYKVIAGENYSEFVKIDKNWVEHLYSRTFYENDKDGDIRRIVTKYYGKNGKVKYTSIEVYCY